MKGYVYDSNSQIVLDGSGRPLTICQQYVADPSKAPGDIRAKINMNFSCSCDAAECREIDQNGKCFFGICPGSLECCDKGGAAAIEAVTPSPAPETGGVPTPGEVTAGVPGDLDSWHSAIEASSCPLRVYPSIIAAQLQLESGAAAHMPPDSNNPFGVKCGNSGPCTGPVSTTECDSSGCYEEKHSFRIYPSVVDAISEHAQILMGTKPGLRVTITGPFSRAIANRDRDGAIDALQSGGYATDPQYAQKLKNIISSRGLDSWDSCVTGLPLQPSHPSTALINCNDYPRGWSTTTDPSLRTDSRRACDTAYKGFYEAVTCERRTGTCYGREWTYDMIPEIDPEQ